MGSFGAAAFAEQVDEGNLSLTTALSWHLHSNHFPPVPAFMVPVALAAVEAGQDEDWDRELDLPVGCSTHKTVGECVYDKTEQDVADFGGCVSEPVVQWQGRDDGKVRAGDVIESFHLDSFL